MINMALSDAQIRNRLNNLSPAARRAKFGDLFFDVENRIEDLEDEGLPAKVATLTTKVGTLEGNTTNSKFTTITKMVETSDIVDHVVSVEVLGDAQDMEGISSVFISDASGSIKTATSCAIQTTENAISALNITCSTFANGDTIQVVVFQSIT